MAEFRVTEISQKKEFDCINRFDKNRSILFLTINSKTRYEQACFVGYLSYLMSYEYIRKSLSWTQDIMLPEIQERGGLFMTDSGAFSFLANIDKVKASDPNFWIPYLEEYVSFLYDNAHNIYCAANLDLDNIVGPGVVDEWNEKYFKPLEEYMQIVYVVHSSYKDPMGYKRIKHYCAFHDYIGIASGLNLKKLYPKVSMLTKSYGARVHGFGFTEYSSLMSQPFFSVDSSTWTMGSRFGETHIDDGRNYRPFNRNYHRYRRKFKRTSQKMGLEFSKIEGRRNSDWDVNVLNLHGWLRFAKNYSEVSNRKLKNEPVNFYKKPFKAVESYPDFYVPRGERKKVKI